MVQWCQSLIMTSTCCVNALYVVLVMLFAACLHLLLPEGIMQLESQPKNFATITATITATTSPLYHCRNHHFSPRQCHRRHQDCHTNDAAATHLAKLWSHWRL